MIYHVAPLISVVLVSFLQLCPLSTIGVVDALAHQLENNDYNQFTIGAYSGGYNGGRATKNRRRNRVETNVSQHEGNNTKSQESSKRDLSIVECGISTNSSVNRWIPGFQKDIGRKRIFGGSLLGEDEFPWLVRIETKYPYDEGGHKKEFRVKCAGVIISRRFVLTNSECFIGKNITDIWAGGASLTPGPVGETFTKQPRKIKQIHDYEGEMVNADLTLIEVSIPYKWNEHVRPLCLPKRPQKTKGQPASPPPPQVDNVKAIVLSGWGSAKIDRNQLNFTEDRIEEFGLGSRARAAMFPLSSQEHCKQYAQESSRLPYNEKYMRCSHFPKDSGDDKKTIATACFGDLGAPAIIYDNETQRFYLYAIVRSHGRICDSEGFTQYTKVGPFLDWIARVVQDIEPPEHLKDKTYQLNTQCGYNPIAQLRRPVRRRGITSSKYKTTDSKDRSKSKARQQRHKRIYGGDVAKLGEVPWFALILPGNCAGTIISSEFILTAAHCVVDNQVTHVKLGVYDRTKFEDSQQRVPVSYAIKYPGYHYSSKHPSKHPDPVTGRKPEWAQYKYDYLNPDVALLKLAEPIKWTEFVRPACLPSVTTFQEFNGGSRLIMAGFGTTNQAPCSEQSSGSEPELADQLMVAAFRRIKTDMNESDLVNANDKNMFFYLDNSWRNNRGQQVTRSISVGDGGGPVLHETAPDRWDVYGIISDKISKQGDCKNSYSVVTSVLNVRDWIVEEVHKHKT